MKEISEKKKKVLFVVGAVLCVLFLFLFSFAFISACDEYCSYSSYSSSFSINKETLEVTYMFNEDCIFLFILSAIALVLAMLSFIFLIFKHSASKKRVAGAIVFIVLFIAMIGLNTVMAISDYKYLQSRIDYQKQEIIDNRLKYTEVSIGDFLDDVNRFPKKYEGKTVTLEGWVRDPDSYYDSEIPGLENDRIETFTLSLNSCSVTVIYYLSSLGASMPRALKGDYAVVTGEAHVFYSEKTQKYVAYLDNSTYEIKDKK